MKKVVAIFFLLCMAYGPKLHAINDSLNYKVFKLRDGDTKLDQLLTLCKTYHDKDFAIGLEYCEACISLADKLHRTSHRAWGHVYLAQSLELLGDYKSMAENYHKAIELFIIIKDSSGMARTYNQLGYVELKLSDTKRALGYFKIALEMMDYVPEDNKRAELYKGVGDLYLVVNKPDSAKLYFDKAFELVKDKRRSVRQADIYESLGRYYLKNEQFDSAIHYFKTNLNILRRLDSPVRGIPALRNLGDVYCKWGSEAKSLHFLTEALSLSLQYRNKNEMALCYESLAKCYEFQNDASKALYYYKQKESLQDSIFNEEKFKSMALIQARFEFNTKKREMEESQLQSIEEERRIRYFWIIFALLTIALSLVSIAGYRIKQKSNEALKIKNEEKDVLIKEVHHRVKNNLQLINSLLNLQRDKVKDKETKKALTESSNRVKSMAMVHQKLYQDEDVSKVDFEDYLNELIEYLATGLQPFDVKVKYKVECEKITFNLQTAIPLGLIINEVITNSLKYAFAKRKTGTITIQATKEPDNIFILIRDDGVGLPKDLDPSKSNTLGMHLIRLLARQIKANIMVNTGRGTRFEIKLKPDE